MGVEKSVRVQEGRLVFAHSSSRDDRLGEVLLRQGRITLHQYVAAGRAISKGKRLGAILVEQGASTRARSSSPWWNRRWRSSIRPSSGRRGSTT